jgi:hypothetical protein
VDEPEPELVPSSITPPGRNIGAILLVAHCGVIIMGSSTESYRDSEMGAVVSRGKDVIEFA